MTDNRVDIMNNQPVSDPTTILLFTEEFWKAKKLAGELVAMFNQDSLDSEHQVIVRINNIEHDWCKITARWTDGAEFSAEEHMDAGDMLYDL